jgi:hypothetical protein
MATDTTLQAIIRDPAWLPHRYDPQHDAFHFLHVPRETRLAAAFLTADYLPTAGKPPLVIERRAAMAALTSRPSPPLHVIFHSAFCCSTLMLRALERRGVASTLSEPVVLNDLVGWRRRGAPAERLGVVLQDTLRLLARPFEDGEAMIVKPSNIVTTIALPLMAAASTAQALAMYAPLSTFLTSVAKKGLEGRLWVRGLFAGFIADGVTDLGFDATALFEQSDLQIAALGWLVQQRLFHRLFAGRMGARLRSLRGDTLVAEPARVVAAAAALTGLPLTGDDARAIGEGPVFRHHAKTGVAFDATARGAEYARSGQQHADEISKVLVWAERVAAHNGIALALPAPLVA